MLMRWRLACVMSIVLCIVTPYTATRAQNTDIALADSEFFERLDERGRVSGDIVMGVMIGPAPSDERDEITMADFVPRPTADITVQRLPEQKPGVQDQGAAARLFCVRINSKDGRFEAANTYAVADGVIFPDEPFRYEGEHAPVVKAMRAVSLVKVGRCGDRTEEVVPSIWNGTELAARPRALHVFVNSAGNPTVATVGTGARFVTCEDVAAPSTLKYTALCILPLSMLKTHTQHGRVTLSLLVTRSLGEEVFEVTVVLPDGRN